MSRGSKNETVQVATTIVLLNNYNVERYLKVSYVLEYSVEESQTTSKTKYALYVRKLSFD